MAQQDQEAQGTVVEVMPSALYRVELANGDEVLCHIALEARRHTARVLAGDRVAVRRSRYDNHRGQILRRLQ